MLVLLVLLLISITLLPDYLASANNNTARKYAYSINN